MRKQSNKGGKEFGDYIIGKTIGEGTFGKVKSATHKPTGQQVAIKILQKTKISEVADVQRVSRQIHILKLIRHPNIVQLYEIIQTPKQLFLIMEYVQGGELFDYIVTNKRIKQQQAVKMFHQLLAGVQYIHRIGIVHRDLKPENILLDYKKALKVVDFGLSNTYKKGELLKTPCGSPCYAAPQMIRGQKYDGLRVDVWSCGVILFAMLCGYLPFQDPDTPALYKKILSGSYTFHKSVSEEAKDLVSGILNGNQNQRLTIEQIRNHRWMSKNECCYSQGIVVGFNRIPIDNDILLQMKSLRLDPDYVGKCLQANRHNNATTSYYLSLKKHISQGGHTTCDLSSKHFDKSVLQPNRRKNTDAKLMIDNYFTKSTEMEYQPKRKSRQKSKQKHENKQNRQDNKENKSMNQPSTVFSSINTEAKKIRVQSKHKINQSFNYGRSSLIPNRSHQKVHRNPLQNKISRKYKEKFNQSLVSRSKEKCSQRSRVNSSLNGCRKEIKSGIVLSDMSRVNGQMGRLGGQLSKVVADSGRMAKNKKGLMNTSVKYEGRGIRI